MYGKKNKKNDEIDISIPGRKICPIDARFRGKKRSKSRSRDEDDDDFYDCDECHPPKPREYIKCYEDEDYHPCDYTKRCPQLEAIGAGQCDLRTKQFFFCSNCEKELPPPPPPPRLCCDRNPDTRPRFRDACPLNPLREPFPTYTHCRSNLQKERFLNTLRSLHTVGPSAYDEPPLPRNPYPLSHLPPGLCFRDPAFMTMDNCPGFRPVRKAMLQSQRRSMKDWVRYADDRASLNTKKPNGYG